MNLLDLKVIIRMDNREMFKKCYLFAFRLFYSTGKLCIIE